MLAPLTGISSMATRQLLAELVAGYARQTGVDVRLESVGGVEAARRVQAGEPFDLVVLASDAIDKLVVSGRVRGGSKIDLVRSGVAIAVRAGAPVPDVATGAALRRTLQGARSIGYSTGPSGTALLNLFERWGLSAELQGRLVQAPAGVPVGTMVARGEVEIGFQQASELLHLDGIRLVGTMPPGTEIVTIFSAGCCAASERAAEVRALLQFLHAPAADGAKRRHGMEPA
jgi:molybdate transport system substrate-binding protein